MSKHSQSIGSSTLEMQALIDALPFYALIVDASHQIVLANKVLLQTLARPHEEVIGGYCPKVVHGTDGPYPGCPLEQALVSNQVEERALFDQQSQRWIFSSIFPTTLQTSEGQRLYLHTARDITEEKNQAFELSRSSEHHEAISQLLVAIQTCRTPAELLDAVIDRLLTLSWLGLTTSAAGFLIDGPALRMEAHRNLSPEILETCSRLEPGQCLCGLAAQTGQTLVVPALEVRHTIRLPGMKDHGHAIFPLIFEERLLGVLNLYLPAGETPDPTCISFLQTVANLAAAGLTGLQQREQATRAQEEKLRLLQRIAGAVSHELGNPMATIKSAAHFFSLAIESPEPEVQETIALLANGVDDATRIITTLLDYALDKPPMPRQVELNALIREELGRFATREQITVTTELNPLPGTLLDPDQVAWVVRSIITNAVQAMPCGGVLRIRTAPAAEGHVKVTVSDTGEGITTQNLPRIFEPLFTTRARGIGLGLSLSQNIVDKHGGAIEVQSEEAHGTTVTLTLPALES